MTSPPPVSSVTTYSKAPPIAVSTVIMVTAAAATYLVIQLLQGGHLITIPGIGVTPHNLTLYSAIGLYGITAILIIPDAIMIKNRCCSDGQTSPNEGLSFLKRFFHNPSQVGAIAPSSHALAVQITEPIPDRSKKSPNEPGQRFLEIGAGTGVFTREIVKKLGPNDHLDVVEYDASFCDQLRQDKDIGQNPKVTIYQISITQFLTTRPYDVIISGLPLNAFEPEFVDAILKKYVELIKPNGIISYFEYIGLEKIKKAFLFGESYRKFSNVLQQKASFVEKNKATSRSVYINIPPARVQCCVVSK